MCSRSVLRPSRWAACLRPPPPDQNGPRTRHGREPLNQGTRCGTLAVQLDNTDARSSTVRSPEPQCACRTGRPERRRPVLASCRTGEDGDNRGINLPQTARHLAAGRHRMRSHGSPQQLSRT